MNLDQEQRPTMTGTRIMPVIGHVVGWGFILLGLLIWANLVPDVFGGYEGSGVEKGLVVLWTAMFGILQSLGVGCILAVAGWRSILGKVVTIVSLLMFVVLIIGVVVGAQPV